MYAYFYDIVTSACRLPASVKTVIPEVALEMKYQFFYYLPGTNVTVTFLHDSFKSHHTIYIRFMRVFNEHPFMLT